MWVDIHYRQTDNFINRPFQFLFRPAVTYFIKDNVRVNVGYALAEHFALIEHGAVALTAARRVVELRGTGLSGQRL